MDKSNLTNNAILLHYGIHEYRLFRLTSPPKTFIVALSMTVRPYLKKAPCTFGNDLSVKKTNKTINILVPDNSVPYKNNLPAKL
jgi:hypothetical protein